MAPHRAISPDECNICIRVFGALEDRQLADPVTCLTTEALGKLIGLKKRATQYHLAHLYAHGRIDEDHRTPLTSGIGQPLLPGAHAWARTVIAPDPTCAKCLIALAGIGWEGQVSQEELAKIAGVSLRTIERHRPHLVAADLVTFRPVTIRASGTTGLVTGRRADRFTLMSGLAAARLAGAAWTEAPARAESLIDRVRWFVTKEPVERDNAVKSVTWFLRAGWPEEALLKALDATENREAYRPGGYLSKLLQKLPVEYIVPARQSYRGEFPERRLDCPVCDTPFKTKLPGNVLCGGAICLTPEKAVIPPGMTIHKIA